MKDIVVTFPEKEFNTVANLLQLICVAGLRLNGEGNAIPTDMELQAVWRILLTAKFPTTEDTGHATEVEYLRFFLKKIVPCLGPGDGDIIHSIKEEFMRKTGRKLPEGYGFDD